jgi:hypothetical protein
MLEGRYEGEGIYIDNGAFSEVLIDVFALLAFLALVSVSLYL